MVVFAICPDDRLVVCFLLVVSLVPAMLSMATCPLPSCLTCACPPRRFPSFPLRCFFFFFFPPSHHFPVVFLFRHFLFFLSFFSYLSVFAIWELVLPSWGALFAFSAGSVYRPFHLPRIRTLIGFRPSTDVVRDVA